MLSLPYPEGDLNPCLDPVLDFPDRDFGTMTAADYAAIGFLSGLEVHQQLLTHSKLFCRCPAGMFVDHCDAEVLRHMRPTLSELGEYDGCALMEFKTRKEIVYLLDRGTVCTYEIDDTPPFEIDEEAVRVALEIADVFNLNLVSELHVMRKQYLDGSIPTGFQRTAMIGLTGEVPFRVPELGIDRMLRIRQVSLEEDSCREISDLGHRILFRTDRLGMPLSEVVTEPDAVTPHELQAMARVIAGATRAIGKVRRGPGAARQDVNVSVAGGRRVEIKGVSNHRCLPRLVHIEAFRQMALLRLREELRRRGVEGQAFMTTEGREPLWERSDVAIDATTTLRHCDYAPLHDALGSGQTVGAVRLRGFAGLLTHSTQPGLTFANELADRVRVIACLTARPFLVHSDLEGYGLAATEWRQVRSALNAETEDACVVCWGPREDVDTALREMLLRAGEALTGIPPETRQALADGTTGFERVLPGADRMYPDTDTPPLPIPDAWVEKIYAERVERPWDRASRYEGIGLPAAAAARLAVAPWAALFDAVAPAAGDVARQVAYALERRLPHRSLPDGAPLMTLVRALEQGALLRSGFEVALARLLANPAADAATLIRELQPLPVDAPELATAISAALGEMQTLTIVDGAELRWAMGRVMNPLRGRIDAALVRVQVEDALRAGALAEGTT